MLSNFICQTKVTLSAAELPMNISHLVMPRYITRPGSHCIESIPTRANSSNQGTKEFSEKQYTAFASLKLLTHYKHSTTLGGSALHCPASFLPYRAIIYAKQKKEKSQGELEQRSRVVLKPAHPRNYPEDSSPARVCSPPRPWKAGSMAPARCRRGPA